MAATDPFSSKDILKPPTIKDDQTDAWHGFKLDNSLHSQSLLLASIQDNSLPNLKPFAFHLSATTTSIERIDADEEAKSEQLSDEHVKSSASIDESTIDIWNQDEICSPATKDFMVGWDQWTETVNSPHTIELFSEAKAPIYDLVNSRIWHKSVGEPLKFVEVEAFQQGLTNLVLGYGSALFEWNDSKSCFQQRVCDYALTGFTQGVTQNICDIFIKCGTTFRRMHLLSHSKSHQIPTLYTLQSSITKILNVLQHDYVSREPHRLTIIELTHVAHTFLELLSLLEHIQSLASELSSESEMLTLAISIVDETWIAKAHLRQLLRELSAHLLQPAIDASFKQTDTPNSMQGDSGYRKWLLGGLLPDHQSIREETTSNMCAIRTCVSEHRLMFDYIPQFQLVRHWSDTQGMVRKANEWEMRLLQSLAEETATNDNVLQNLLSNQQTVSPNPFAVDFSYELVENQFIETGLAESFAAAIMSSMQQQSSESLYALSPQQALEHTVIPVLNVQHRITSYVLMRTLFLEHNLLAHLSHLQAFQLLRDGSFAVRLSRALFDSEQDSAEDLRKTGLSTGLRLEDREVWPPASSELRLVLMSLLSEPSAYTISTEPSKCISFAIRELPEDKLDLCRNMHSIHALDFLRLVYTLTDSVLELVITPASLDKYDRIFGFLLILLRIHSLTQSLLTATTCLRPADNVFPAYQRLCLELHHVATTFVDYALNVAIGIPSMQFSEKADIIHHLLSGGAYQDSLQAAGSIAGLCQLHEEMLDQCMKSLLLKKQQHEAYDTICKVFSLILKVASVNQRQMHNRSILKQRNEYIRLVRLFVTQIKTISISTQDSALKRLEFLLLRIDSDYFGNSDDNDVPSR